MRPLAVVDTKPRVGEGAQLCDRFEEVRVQHLSPIAPIETLDVRVLVRLTGLDVVRRHTVFCAPVDKGLRRKFGPVVDAYVSERSNAATTERLKTGHCR